jgi:hypothetical protein
MGLAFADRVYPKVAIGGIEVGGLTGPEATARVRAHATQAMGRPLLIRAGPAGPAGSEAYDAVTTSLGELGVTVGEDGVGRSVRAALAVGRPAEGGPFGLDAAQHLMWLWRHGEQIALPLAVRMDVGAGWWTARRRSRTR